MPTISECPDPLNMTTTWWSTTSSGTNPSMSTSNGGTSSGLPSPTLSSASGSTSPRSVSSGSTEFSWPLDSGLGSGSSSSCSSGAGSPPLPATDHSQGSIWGSTPAASLSAPTTCMPEMPPLPAYNPLVPPPALPPPGLGQTHGGNSFFAFPPPPAGTFQQHQQQQDLLRSFSGGYMSELERLFVSEPIVPQLPCPMPMPPKKEDDAPGYDFRTPVVAPKMWEDFERNGIDRELDDMDKIMRSMTMKERKPRRLPTMEELKRHDQTDPIIRKTMMLRLVSEMESRGKAHPYASEIKNSDMLCRFCWKNGETEVIYKSHNLKDKQGRICCPILYVYECPLCGAKGANSHTKKYCPMNNAEAADAPSLKTGRNAAGKRRIVGQSPVGATPGAMPLYTLQELQVLAALTGVPRLGAGAAAASGNKLWPTTLDSYLNPAALQMLAFEK